MNTRMEKLAVSMLLIIFFATMAGALIIQGFSLTEEEAIEISRNSETVRQYVAGSDRYSLDVHYMNSSEVNKAREDFPDLREIYPENRNVWTVTWYIHPQGAPSAAAFVVSQVIDDETGQILNEGISGLK